MTSKFIPRAALAAALIATSVALPALASDPASGDVSNAAPSITWKGTAGGYGVSILADVNGSFPACAPPTCDEFALNVKDQADLNLAITTDDGTGFTTIEVESPDGTIVYNGGAAGEATSKIKLKNAKPGAYKVRTMTNNPPATGDAYTGVATLGSAAAPAPSTPASGGPTTAPPPGATPAPWSGGTTPAPAPASTATITVKAGKLSAKKLSKSKKLALKVSTDSPLTGVVGKLLKGKKVVGTGKLAKLDSTGKLTLRIKGKLKKGAYVIQVAGKTASGNVAGTQVKAKVAK